MNKQRRKELVRAASLLEGIKEDFDEAKTIIETVAGEEEEAFGNLTEGLQQSERGQAMEAASSKLQDIVSTLGEIDFDEILGGIEEASE